MRTVTLLSALFLSASLTPPAAEISATDRQRLVAHMDMTAGWLEGELANLSQAQAEFRRAPGAWTILEVLEHLIVVGPIYWQDLQKGVASKPPAAPLASRDVDILWYGIDRGYRETALTSENPKGELRSVRAGLETYRKQHAQLLQYVKTTKDDLRNRVVERQRCDGYQWALLISTHEQRHILQIREIKADPKFPVK